MNVPLYNEILYLYNDLKKNDNKIILCCKKNSFIYFLKIQQNTEIYSFLDWLYKGDKLNYKLFNKKKIYPRFIGSASHDIFDIKNKYFISECFHNIKEFYYFNSHFKQTLIYAMTQYKQTLLKNYKKEYNYLNLHAYINSNINLSNLNNYCEKYQIEVKYIFYNTELFNYIFSYLKNNFNQYGECYMILEQDFIKFMNTIQILFFIVHNFNVFFSYFFLYLM